MQSQVHEMGFFISRSFTLDKHVKYKEEIEQVKIETPEEKAERLKEGRLYMEWRSKHLKQEDISK